LEGVVGNAPDPRDHGFGSLARASFHAWCLAANKVMSTNSDASARVLGRLARGQLKILSIRQPWADLIVRGGKDIENRSWPAKYRGPILVHASLKLDREACNEYGLHHSRLLTGGIVGIAEITDCVLKHQSTWYKGPYGFVLRNRRPLEFLEWPGALGLCDAPLQLRYRLKLMT
jgi:hypothetical protein